MKVYRNIPVECVNILELVSLLATDPVRKNKPGFFYLEYLLVSLESNL